jgi:putative membrane protein
MHLQQSHKGIGRFLIAAIVAAALGGCATSREQPSAAASNASALPVQPSAPIAHASTAKPRGSTATPPPEVSDKSTSAAILEQIYQADLEEIAIAEIAEEKASTREIRAYAEQLVADHTNANQTVVRIAKKLGVHLHDAATSKEARRRSVHEKLVEQKMSSASSAEFDRLFLQQTSADHDKLIRALKQDREDANNDDIESLIDKILPILEQHRELAQILMKKEQA